ncbi:putative response regulatory protein [compost metagenome]
MYKVFIVDDEPFIIEGLYDIVDWSMLGMEIVGYAENGCAALKALTETPTDILITDISMPKMNGLDLIRQIRQLKPELKVIVLSGYDEFAYLKEGMTLGIENYLLKPINLEEFQATLNAVHEKLNASRNDEALSEYSIRILRDNVMYRWVCNQIEEREFRERIDLLGLQIDKPYVLITLCRVRTASSDLLDLIEQSVDSIERLSTVITFQDTDGDIILLFNFDDPGEGRLESAELIDELSEKLRDLDVQLSEGSVESLEDGAHLSYENAKKAQEYFLIYSEQTTIRFDELKSPATSSQLAAIDWDESTRLLLARDREELFALIDQQFAYMGEIAGVTPLFLQDMALEWLVRFKMQLQKIRYAEEPRLIKEGYDQIKSAGTMEELVIIVKKMAEMAIDVLNGDVKSPIVQQVLSYIHVAYNQDLSLKTLGNTYNIHPVYLGQLFHKEVGESFTEYINRYRIEKAKELLKTTHQKVHEIARNVGYWETGYFYKQFKKYVGVSPKEYKGLG